LIRKHRIALLAAAAYNFVFFFPTLFMGRVVSPNDIFYNFAPWSLLPHATVQNSLFNDPPTAYFTLMSLLEGGGAFQWNPYVACGIPGVGSSAAAVLSPFILIPVFALPLAWVYTGIVFLKLNLAFFFAYLWLREERLGKKSAAIGAIVVAGAGVYAVRWLWQATNATALYPALLWSVRRLFNGKRLSFAITALIALAYALAGFPSTMAYGATVAIAYAVFLAVRERVLPLRAALAAIASVVLALLIAAPSLIPFAQLVHRSGYLGIRENVSLTTFYPVSELRSYIAPERLGSNALKNWRGDRALPPALNNFIEATVYVGIVALPLALIALANRRARSRWFWVAAAAVILCAMFGFAPVAQVIGRLPGFKYSPLARLSILMPLPAGYLAAAGSAWLLRLVRGRGRAVAASIVAAVLAVVAAGDLALFAGRFYPYLAPSQTLVPETTVIAFLRAQKSPFRIAPFFDYLWPNSAELFRLEDVRSHFGSEAKYRRLLQRVDPTSWSGQSTVLQFNSLKFNFSDPITGMLGIRYYIEHKSIDIIRWTIFSSTVQGVKENGAFVLEPGAVVQRSVRVDVEPFYALELPVIAVANTGPSPRLVVQLMRFGAVVYEREFTPDDIAVMGKVYIPLRPYARLGESAMLRIQAIGMRVTLLRSVPSPGEDPICYARVKTPVIFDRELPDGRVFLNAAEVPRFRAARRVSRMSEEQFLARRDIDLLDEAVITDPSATLPPTSDSAIVYLTEYAPARQRVKAESPAPFFLASSEKLTPELAIAIDGRQAKPIEINSLFAGVSVPAGSHTIVFSRRIARGWWWLSGVALLVFAVITAIEIAFAVRRGKNLSPQKHRGHRDNN
jgi:hypothetical protein